MRDSNTASADASQVSLTNPVRGETTVQQALEAAVPVMLTEESFFATTSAPPGDIYATDTRVWQAGNYHLTAVTTASASGPNTEIEVVFGLDGFDVPNAWSDTPGSGTLRASGLTPIALTGGSHTFTVKLSRVNGTGDAQAHNSRVELERV